MQEQRKIKIHYSLKARRDLDAIWDYYLEEYQSVDAAVKTIDAIMADIDQLAFFPEMGPPLSSIADVDAGYRFLVPGNYLSFYRFDGSDVSIDRVLYGRRDYLSVLLSDLDEKP
ncbi:MAG: type II toxin-antitoxin system RelE/ParE family toxin [Oscillospiraceae bacterium]|nr:type II toxin-antitoxin system RelE/ParE family toxin [Oscillospiraceae bacterium]